MSTACVLNDCRIGDFHATLCNLGHLDILGSDPYWFFGKEVIWVREVTKAYKQLCKDSNKDCWIVIQSFHVPSGRENEIYEAGKIAAEEGADILCGWYHWRGTENRAVPPRSDSQVHQHLNEAGESPDTGALPQRPRWHSGARKRRSTDFGLARGSAYRTRALDAAPGQEPASNASYLMLSISQRVTEPSCVKAKMMVITPNSS